MLHLLLTLNALSVMIFLLVRMSSRDHIADPIAVLLWLTLCLFAPVVLVAAAAATSAVLLFDSAPASLKMRLAAMVR